MKQTLVCPKCAGRKIWAVEKFRLPGDTAEGKVLPVVPHQESTKRSALFSAMRAEPHGAFDLYVCDGCGYSELWARDLGRLVADPARGIRLVDNSDLKEGPFR